MPNKLGFGPAWLALAAALALHVTDEALTGFLGVYNPTVAAIRARLPWLPIPVFRFDIWLALLIAGILLLAALAPAAFHGNRYLRRAGYTLAALMLSNGGSHILGTIAGRTVAAVRFPRPMPGFWSSPLLIAASLWLLFSLRTSAHAAAAVRQSVPPAN
ncbi:membrane hypothetical protein [Candidatus Sulfopaludibacter sp. SbA4]|nr:membrane hypothetical protein [Candidatus Sulfopaludibacter sp. SbA4]